jgi:hypothetical protein
MSEPIIFIAHQKIKQGKVEEYKKYYQEVAEWRIYPPQIRLNGSKRQ